MARQPDGELARWALDDVIRRFGHQHHRTVTSERRDRLAAALFDVPRRSSLAAAVYLREVPDLLRELSRRIDAAELGRRMKRPGSRPNYLHLWALLTTYFTGREQRLLDAAATGAVADDPVADVRTVVDFFLRVVTTYREDDGLFPGERDDTQRVLAAEQVTEITAMCAPVGADAISATRARATALSLYGFVLHGEQRDGLFAHGPYRGPDGVVVWFEEITDLRTSFLPWAPSPPAFPVDDVILVLVSPDADVRCANTGSVHVVPTDYAAHVRAVAVLTRTGESLAPLSSADLDDLARSAARAQAAVLEDAATWSDAFRVEYGSFVFGSHIASFFELAGVPDGARLVREAFARSTPEALADVTRSEGLPSFWAHLAAAAPGETFSPVGTSDP